MFNLKISNHSVLRFMQRYPNLDITEIKEKIKDIAPMEAMEALGDGIYPDKTNTVRFLVRNKTIITVLPMKTLEHIDKNIKQKRKRNLLKKISKMN